MNMDLSLVEPYEISSIRPPTENFSLTFKLTRNCYWNKCKFCPSYKLGARFSKRNMEEVREDIRRAKVLDDLMSELGIDASLHQDVAWSAAAGLLERINRARERAGLQEMEEVPADREELDPRMAWFSSWFKHRPKLEDSLDHILSWRMNGGKTCFLGDADSLIVAPDFMAQAIEGIRGAFPSIERFTVYGRTRSAARLRTVDELRAYREAGLDRVHFGLESGCDEVLRFVSKGETRNDHIEGCLKTIETGLSCSVYVMPGLGGKEWSERHAHETAALLSNINPDFIRVRSLQVFPQTPLAEEVARGGFTEASEEEVVKEIRILVEETDAQAEFLSDSATNLLDIFGRLPEDRDRMLETVDRYLALDKRDRVIYGFESRLRSFMGQYGGLTKDISAALSPFLKGDSLDFSRTPDREIEDVTRLIRSRLMP